MNSKTLESIYKYITLTGLFAVLFLPLYIENSFFFPFITGKGFAFRIIVEIIFASWILLFLRNNTYLPKWSSIQVCFTIFTVVLLIADILGVSFLRSFWSNFERMDGWLTLVHLWGYFMVLSSMFSVREGDRRMWNNYFNVSLFVAGIVGIYGFSQLFGFAKIHQGSARIDASLGNAIYLAVYMMFNSLLAIYMAFDSAEKKNNDTSLYAVSLYSILAIVFAFLMFETSTRGVVLGYILGIIVGLIMLAISGKNKQTKLISVALIASILIVGGIFWSIKDTKFVQNNPNLKRFAEISLSDTKTQARGYIWPMAVKGVFSTPKTSIIGWGQENFNYIFNANYNPEMWRHEQWFDRAHNTYLDWLVAGGVIGLLAYLSIFIFTLVSIAKSNLNINEKAVIVAILIGYSVQSIFTFDNLISYMYLYIVLGFISGIRSSKEHAWIKKITLHNSKNYHIYRDYFYTPVIAIAFIVVMFSVNIRPIQANTSLIDAMITCSGGNQLPSVSAFQKVVDYDKYMASQEAREQTLSCATNVINSGLPQNLKVDFANLAGSQIDAQMNVTPNDARIYYLGGVFMNNAGSYSAGKLLLEKANTLSPNKQSIILELATNYVNTGDVKGALEIIKKAYEGTPDNDNVRSAYMSLLILNGEESKLKTIFKDKYENTYYDEKIVGVYMNKKQYNKAIEIYNYLIGKYPSMSKYYLGIAGVYYSSGDKYSAINELKIVGDKFPELKKQTEDAIKEVQKVK